MTRPRRGASAVEFALTLPVILVIASAVIDYGWYLHQATSVVHAVREGARFGSTVALDDGPDVEAVNQTTTVLNTLGVPCSSGAGCEVAAILGTTGTLTSMTVTAEIEYLAPFGLVPTPEVLRGQLTMAVEDQSEE